MKKMPRISEAEWEVMKVLWGRSPATANHIVEVLSRKTHWQRETIRTLINRLVHKEALGFQRQGRQYHYSPLVSEAECVRAETRSFLDRVHGGSIEPMLAAFVEERRLSPGQLERLRQILAGEKPGSGKKKRKQR